MSDALMEDMISVALKWNKQIIIGKSQKQSLAATVYVPIYSEWN